MLPWYCSKTGIRVVGVMPVSQVRFMFSAKNCTDDVSNGTDVNNNSYDFSLNIVNLYIT